MSQEATENFEPNTEGPEQEPGEGTGELLTPPEPEPADDTPAESGDDTAVDEAGDDPDEV
jgi:hypothetical protein